MLLRFCFRLPTKIEKNHVSRNLIRSHLYVIALFLGFVQAINAVFNQCQKCFVIFLFHKKGFANVKAPYFNQMMS